jgi:hypothetical protein
MKHHYFNIYPLSFLILLAVILASESSLADAPDEARVLSFPGAVGGGKYTTGGRGGKVIKVTNLNDSGPGSLREAINQPEPRIIVFDVSGTIELKSPLNIYQSNLTIAGQSAPGDGICIKGHQCRISADNIIIRYIRFRPGDISGKEYDALAAINQRDIIIDHCSMSWSTDETASFYDNENFTMQWCLISESLNNSVHSKGAHGYGGIWGGKNATFIYNVLAHHNSRNPRLQGARYQEEENREKTELINNIIYNWGSKAIYGGENGRYNILHNIFIPGPATRSNRNEILEPYNPLGSFFLEGNVIYENRNSSMAEWENVSLPDKVAGDPKATRAFEFTNPTPVAEASALYEMVLSKVGASLSRDKTDHRVIDEIKSRKYTYGNYGIIDSQDQTDGWPELKSLPPKPDSDGDGMPDEWEKQVGLNPNDYSDHAKHSLDPHYTNIEVYLNSLLK